MKYCVLGATGRTGGIVATELLKDGYQVRAVARSLDKLEPLRALGAEPCVADLQVLDDVKRAFADIEAAYVMIPPNFTTSDFRKFQDEVTDNIADAIATNGTKYTVSLSSIGAENPKGVGPVNGLHYMEVQLDGIPDLNTLHVRAGFFMENLLGSLGMIKGMRIYGAACPPDAAWPLISTGDIGHYAAQRLKALNFSGKNVQFLLGPRDVTGEETARILAAAFGMEALPYVHFTYEDMKKGMVGGGVLPNTADLFVELYDGFNKGLLTYHRDAESTTNTKLEDFAAKVLKPAFDSR